jgi:hypothetical protein
VCEIIEREAQHVQGDLHAANYPHVLPRIGFGARVKGKGLGNGARTALRLDASRT